VPWAGGACGSVPGSLGPSSGVAPRVLLKSSVGKVDLASCEDVVVAGERVLAVVDGATDKSGLRYRLDGEEVSAGRFAASVVAESLGSVPVGVSALDAVGRAAEALAAAREEQHPGLPREHYPSAVASLLHVPSRLLVIVGDARAAWETPTGLREASGSCPPDEVLSAMRALVLSALEAAGRAWDGVGEDPGRAAIMPALRVQGAFANRPGPWGYSVFNGEAIPEGLLLVEDLSAAGRVVLASDGYPSLVVDGGLSYTAAERRLVDLVRTDPLCVGELRGTKGMHPGRNSFDDRSWLEVATNW